MPKIFDGNKICKIKTKNPPIAQLVEQSPLKRTVAGSNPAGRIRRIRSRKRGGVFAQDSKPD